MMKPSRESKTAKRIWKRAERRSVMARTADIQVRANRGRTTQELHSDALQGQKTAHQRQQFHAGCTFCFSCFLIGRLDIKAHHQYTCIGTDEGDKCNTGKINKTYPALSFSFTSVMPSLDTSLLKTRIPMTMLTC